MLSAKHYREHIALESDFTSNVIKLVKSALPSFIHELLSSQEKLSNQQITPDVVEILKLTPTAFYKSKSLDLMLFGDSLVSAPENFTGKYLEYVVELSAALTDTHNTVNMLLAHVNTYVSTLVTNPEFSLNGKENTIIYHKAENQRQAINHKLAKFFPKETGVSKQKISTLLNRFQDIDQIKPKIEQLRKVVDGLRFSEINEHIRETSELSDMLLKNISSQDIKAITPAVAKNLSEGLYETARHVELLTVIYFDAVVFIKCYKELLEHISKA